MADAHARADAIRTHAATTAEVRALCADLQVLGRSEFKQLLRWRLRVRGDVLKAELAARKEVPVLRCAVLHLLA